MGPIGYEFLTRYIQFQDFLVSYRAQRSGSLMRPLELLFRTAVSHFNAGLTADAESVCRELLAIQPECIDGLQLLGLILSQADREAEAIPFLKRASDLQPENPLILNNFGEALRRCNQLDEAATVLKRATELAPKLAEAHFNLGNVWKQLGRIDDAIAAYTRTLAVSPLYAKAHYNLGNLLREEGRVSSAIVHYHKALASCPDWADVHLNLGTAYLEAGNLDDAKTHFAKTQQLDPTKTGVDANLGQACVAAGDVQEAESHYRRHYEQTPSKLGQMKLASLCEVIAPNREYITNYQRRLAELLERSLDHVEPCDLAELHTSGAEPPMNLAYHGGSVRALAEQYARYFEISIPGQAPPANPGRPRLGVVVTHGHEGVFARCWGGIYERLSRQQLDVYLICSRAGANVLSQMMRVAKEEVIILPARIDAAAKQLRELKCDVLFYWEIGTDSTNYFLPYLRPAGVQLANWGWPVTTGNLRVTHFLSAQALEPGDAQDDFSETLLLHDHLPAYYERPPVPQDLRGREQVGLPTHDHVYLCTQNLRKYHPDFDSLLADILRTDPRGRLVIIADAQPSITRRLLDRFARNMPDVRHRVQVLPRMERALYLNVIALADVVLDTLHYGGGANTVYDAVAAGTPIITLPGAFHRSRWTAAAYERLGIVETIATDMSEYVRLAVTVATTPDFRQRLSEQLLDAGGVLFADACTVAEHEETFLNLVAQHRSA